MRRCFGVGFAAEALAMAAILAGAERDTFRICVRRAGIGRGSRERVIAEALARRLHRGARHALGKRLVGVLVLARALEDVAAVDELAAQVAGLPGNAGELLEAVVVRLELVVADGIVRDRHLRRNRVAPVALRDVAAQEMVGRRQPPGHAVPMLAGAAQPGAGQERAEPPDRQRGFRRRVAQRHRFHLRVLKQFLAHRIFEVVAHRWDGEVLARRAHGTALEAHDMESGFGQLAGEDRAGPADADDNRIRFPKQRGHGALPRKNR